MAAEVVTFGESMVVFVPETAGPLRHAERFARGVAGAESNVAIGLCRLGHPAAWLGRLGDDEFGRFIAATLRGEGVQLADEVLDARAPTGVMFKERRAGGDSRVFYYRRGSAASLLGPEDLPEAAIRTARWLHLTGITPALGPGPRQAVLYARALARRHGVPFSFDPNYRARLWPPEEAAPVLRELAAGADVLLLSESEGELLFGTGDPESVAAAALAAGTRVVAVKRGERGALLRTADGGFPIPVHPVAAVESTGAGDAFAAGLIAGLLEGRPPEEAGRMGAIAGALVCTVPGDWEGAPERRALQGLLEGRREWLR
jgi:2-dehydro-3-deoxygluconokinase